MRLKAGDGAAWTEFLRRYGRLIRYLGRRLRLDPEEIDDLLQSVSLQVHRKIGTLENPKRLVSWTYSVALNEGRQILRKRRPTESLDQPSVLREVEAETPDLPSEDELREALSDADQLRTALAQIDVRCRRLIEALYFRDPRPAYSEISEEFEIAVGSIGPIRGRCLERLTKKLEDVSNGRAGASTSSDGDEPRASEGSHEGITPQGPRSARSASRRER
ncbi:MAG: sigma-70 family RNA polymerase sigma factor [Candidatus Eisenbacteria bacterium]